MLHHRGGEYEKMDLDHLGHCPDVARPGSG